jgi:hypothetical protein
VPVSAYFLHSFFAVEIELMEEDAIGLIQEDAIGLIQ